MSKIPFKTISLSGEAVKCLKTAPRESLEHIVILACSALADISTGTIQKPPKSDLEMVMLMFFEIAIDAKLLPAAEADAAMREAEQPEPTVSDVSQAADLLKKFSLH